ncbi:MAG TPA: hypothetical protein PKX16_09240, partial [Kiritimatiellia bacterium]|nr:hypothetical protein [Kiritimatiellia bacterium]
GQVCRGLGIGREDLRRRRGGGWMRGVAAEMLTKFAGLKQEETARLLEMGTGAAVSMRLKDLARRRRADRRLDAQVGRMEQEMRAQLLA